MVRVTIKLYREPYSLIFNGFFPMIIVNCGTILVAIPQASAGARTQLLKRNSVLRDTRKPRHVVSNRLVPTARHHFICNSNPSCSLPGIQRRRTK